ncbi:MAG: General stress protein 18 [Acinetobacter bereziniae]|uniref:General stress protein 18 n=1 Tax=Acinetobacter bereziniae TaxID=106648 RepID=A0A833PIX4_ACIBZ|nr:MAG: General stress protein 18 [Acinetobacter bereziniae]
MSKKYYSLLLIQASNMMNLKSLWIFLNAKGIESIHAAIELKDVQTVLHDDEKSAAYMPNAILEKLDPHDYDLLVIPGGTVNADQLRMDENAIKIIQSFTNDKKPIAAICHGPWALINAERVKDKNLTSFKSIRLDLENAGANWLDEEVHRCNTGGWVLITSRNPDDIPAFNNAILQELA